MGACLDMDKMRHCSEAAQIVSYALVYSGLTISTFIIVCRKAVHCMS